MAVRVNVPSNVADPTRLKPEGFSDEAFRRLCAPKHRGAFFNEDAARKQLGLLTAGGGEAKLYWLLNLDADVVQEARYLAYGGLTSGPVADAFCEAVQGKRFEDACAIGREEVTRRLGAEPFAGLGAEPFGFLAELQKKLRQARHGVVLLPKPADEKRYVRKPVEEMNEADKNWLPLGLAKKLEQADALLKTAVAARLHLSANDLEITGLHDDLNIVLRLHKALAPEQVPTSLKLAEEVFRSRLHPEIVVKEGGT